MRKGTRRIWIPTLPSADMTVKPIFRINTAVYLQIGSTSDTGSNLVWTSRKRLNTETTP